MRTIVHLSDLHFGQVNYETLEPLLKKIKQINPDIVIVSGDLTQRAQKKEFLEAGEFLRRLGKPRIVIPGNHDVPLYNLFSRLFRPHKRFKKFIAEDLEPFYNDKQTIIVGLNTAVGLTLRRGSLKKSQIARAIKLLKSNRQNMLKIVVTHHPFEIPNHVRHPLIRRANKILNSFSSAKPDIFLAGDAHLTHASQSTFVHKTSTYKSLIALAGTATSTRTRKEVNSFSVIKFKQPQISIEQYTWQEKQKTFELMQTQKFIRHEQNGWSKI